MPITPFHFGPGALLYAAAPRHVSFLAFCAANVVIDVESLYNLVSGKVPVHAFMHTWIGATLAAAITVALAVAARRLPLAERCGCRAVSLRQIAIGAVLGAYTHIVFDGVMHHDMAPLAPFSQSNALLGAVSMGALDWFCIACGAAALAVLGIRKLLRPRA